MRSAGKEGRACQNAKRTLPFRTEETSINANRSSGKGKRGTDHSKRIFGGGKTKERQLSRKTNTLVETESIIQKETKMGARRGLGGAGKREIQQEKNRLRVSM